MLKKSIILGSMMMVLPLAIACGGDDDGDNGNNTIDAAVAVPDATVQIDANVGPTAGCMSYCDNAMENCTVGNVLYPGMAECLSSCAAIPEGNAADMTGNSAYCRAYHAGPDAAAIDPGLHCPHASNASDGSVDQNDQPGVCGSLCEAYCDQVMANCSGANEQYTNRAACDAACVGMNDGEYGDQGGDTIQCRIYHSSFPAAAMPEVHCDHAGATPTVACVDAKE